MNVQSVLKCCTTYIRLKLMYCSSLSLTSPPFLQLKNVQVILKAPKAFSVSEGKLLSNIPVLETYRKQLFHKFTCKLLKQKSSYIKKSSFFS